MTRTSKGLSLPASIFLTAIFLGGLSFFLLNETLQGEGIYSLIYGLYLTVLIFLIFHTGRISHYRRIFFMTIALVFFPSFIHHLILERGAMTIDSTQFVNGETPFCHIVIPLTLIPMVLKRTVIFPGRLLNHYASIYSMLTIWLFLTLALGRGWCSWVCFYGGWDDGCSSMGKKRPLKINSRAPWVTHLPKAVLLFLVLGSLITLTSIYCDWFCPFKLITEYENPHSLRSMIAFILMVLLFFGLLIIGPILSGKRTNCGLFCPMGALQGMIGNRVSSFKIFITEDKCNQCGLCERSCPSFSMGEKGPRSSCTLCGECMDICPRNAIDITLKGKDYTLKKGPLLFREILQPRNLFILGAFLGGSIISLGFAKDSLSLLVNLFQGAAL